MLIAIVFNPYGLTLIFVTKMIQMIFLSCFIINFSMKITKNLGQKGNEITSIVKPYFWVLLLKPGSEKNQNIISETIDVILSHHYCGI